MTRLHHYTAGDISLPLPAGWEATPHAPDAAIAAAEPYRSGRFTTNVVVTVEDGLPAGDTLDAWTQRTIAALEQQVTRFRVIDLEDAEVDRRTAFRVLSHYPLSGFGGVTLEQWLLPDGPRGVIVSCSTATMEYDDRADLFSEIVAGLRLGIP